MNYKFQVGDLVRVRPDGGTGYLGLVTDRPHRQDELFWYKILVQGYTVHCPEHELTKVSENNEL